MSSHIRLCVVGSRGITDPRILANAIHHCFGFLAQEGYPNAHLTQIVSGGAEGVDTLAAGWAVAHNVELREYLPDWERYGRGRSSPAPHIRNRIMVEHCDAVLGIWDGSSHGTRETLTLARRRGLPVYVCYTAIPDEEIMDAGAHLANGAAMVCTQDGEVISKLDDLRNNPEFTERLNAQFARERGQPAQHRFPGT